MDLCGPFCEKRESKMAIKVRNYRFRQIVLSHGGQNPESVTVNGSFSPLTVSTASIQEN